MLLSVEVHLYMPVLGGLFPEESWEREDILPDGGEAMNWERKNRLAFRHILALARRGVGWQVAETWFPEN